MIFYILFIAAIFVLLGNYKIGSIQKPYSFTIIGVLLLIFVISFRFDIGVDYSEYYNGISMMVRRGLYQRYEPLNSVIIFLTGGFNKPWITIAIYGALTVIIAFIAIKKYSGNIFLGMITYTAIFYLFAFSTIRQGLASVIILAACGDLVKGNKKFYLYVLIGTLFHSSAVIAIIFPIIYRMNPRYLLLLIVATCGIFTFISPYLSSIPVIGKYYWYLNQEVNFGGGNFQRLFMWGILIILWILRPKGNHYVTHLLCVCSFGAIFPAILGAHIGGRVAQYMYIYLCIVAPIILTNRHILIKSAYLSLMIFWMLAYTYIGEDNGSKSFIPYKTIFQINTNNPHFK